MSSKVTLEVCIDSIASGLAAEIGGASRIELCSALSEGGLTPSVGFLQKIKSAVKIPIFVMIRPRCGDFLYSDDEIDIMKNDIKALKEHGADGFVFGVLNEQGQIDEVKCQTLLSVALPSPVTFHRAFDQITRSNKNNTSNFPYDDDSSAVQALETLIRLGFTRLLTSGQQANAQKGIPLIKRLVEKSNGRIKIMAGAGISPSNVTEIVEATGVTEVHASARKPVKSLMIPSPSSEEDQVTMGSQEDDFTVLVTDATIVQSIVQSANAKS